MVGVLSSLGAAHRILANGIADEPITLDSDDKPDDDNSNLDAEHASRTLNSGQPRSNAFILKHPPMLSNRTASEHDGSDINIDDTKSRQTAKRPRPCSSILPHTRILPFTKMGKAAGKISITAIPTSQETAIAGQSGGKFLLRHNRSQRSPSLVSEEDDGTLSSSASSKLASTARTSPASKTAPLTEPQLFPQAIDADQDWEVRQIIGKEDVDGVLHYMVDWHPTTSAGTLVGKCEGASG
jgi:hypothetical protein